jgi:uncharacterized protein YjbI with pentapeptide repeats
MAQNVEAQTAEDKKKTVAYITSTASPGGRRMLHFSRMVSLFDPVFKRQAEGLPIRDEDIAQMKYHLPESTLPPPERQEVLRSLRATVADPVTETFPFRDQPLSRADLLWLITNSKEPLDLRGANLSGADLRKLDLSNCILGLGLDDLEQSIAKLALSLGSTKASMATLSEAAHVQMRDADLSEAQLVGVNLARADLRGAVLIGSDLRGADLSEANLERAQLQYALLGEADLHSSNLQHSNLQHCDMRNCNLQASSLVAANLRWADLRGGTMAMARFGGADLTRARFDGASDLHGISLVEHSADLVLPTTDEDFPNSTQQPSSASTSAFLVDVDWGAVNLTGINWDQLIFVGEEHALRSRGDRLEKLAQARQRLSEVNKLIKDLQPIEALQRLERDYMVGDPPEPKANLTKEEEEELPILLETVSRGSPLVEESLRLSKLVSDMAIMIPSDQLHAQEDSARVYRQLANVLTQQGLIKDASRFSYKALQLRRIVPRRERQFYSYLPVNEGARHFRAVIQGLRARILQLKRLVVTEGKVFGSFLVDALCGYGYRPSRAILTYLGAVILFAGCYAWAGLPLFPDAFVFSITSFHGRGFSSLLTTLSSVREARVVEIAAVEAFVGLLMEVVLVATFTRRLFDR